MLGQKRGPIPLIVCSSASDFGRRSSTSASTRSVATVYAGLPSARSIRHARRRSNCGPLDCDRRRGRRGAWAASVRRQAARVGVTDIAAAAGGCRFAAGRRNARAAGAAGSRHRSPRSARSSGSLPGALARLADRGRGEPRAAAAGQRDLQPAARARGRVSRRRSARRPRAGSGPGRQLAGTRIDSPPSARSRSRPTKPRTSPTSIRVP